MRIYTFYYKSVNERRGRSKEISRIGPKAYQIHISKSFCFKFTEKFLEANSPSFKICSNQQRIKL